MIQHYNIIDFVKELLTGYSKMNFNTSDLKNLRQYNYYKDQLISKSL